MLGLAWSYYHGMSHQPYNTVPSSGPDVQKSYEARVAVMGFKCRQMQLQGEVEHLRGMVNKPSETVSSIC